MSEANTAAAARLDDLESVLEIWRTEESTGGSVSERVRFVLEFKTPPTDQELTAMVADAFKLSGLLVEPLFPGDAELARFRLLRIPSVSRLDRSDMFEVAATLRLLTGAETVEPDVGTNYFQEQGPPPPPGSPESSDWAFWCWADDNNAGLQDKDWAIKSTRVPDAWAFSLQSGRPEKGKGIRIFQPDTGVVPAHVELPKDAHKAKDAINFVEPGKPPVDAMGSSGNPGHGTGTGSVAASPETHGMRGTAPLADLVPIRCIESVAVFDQSLVARAVNHATNAGAHVISMSLGGIMSSALHAAVRKAADANVIVVAAAGNCVEEVVWPARYEEVVAVAGTNEKKGTWKGSCHGASVDISGPAEFVLRADPRDRTNPTTAIAGGQGTSFATALTAGIAALWLAHHGRNTLIALLPAGKRLHHMFRSLARASADTNGGTWDTKRYGAGIINALELLKREPQSAFSAGEPEAAQGSTNAELRELLESAFGNGGLEAAAPALQDRQFAPELACLAFDKLRQSKTRRAMQEALPPLEMSPSLRRVAGLRLADWRS